MGGGGTMRRVDTSSSSLDRMIGEDLPAMLSGAMSKARDEHHSHGPPLPSRHLPLSRSSSMVSVAEHAELESGSTSPRYSYDSPPRRTTNLSRLASDDLFASSSGRDDGEHHEDMRQGMDVPVRHEKIKRTSSLMRVGSIGHGLAESFSNLLSFGSLTRTPEKASAGLNRRTSIDSNESGGADRNRVSFSSLAQLRERTPYELPRMFSEAGVCTDPADAPTAADVYAAAMSLQETPTTAPAGRAAGVSKSNSAELEASGSAGSVDGRHGGFGGVFNVGSMHSLLTAASNSLKRVPSMKAIPSRDLTPVGPTVVFFNLPWAGHAFPTYPLAAQMVAKGVKMHYFQDVVHKKLIKQMGAEFHNYGSDNLKIPDAFSKNRGLAKPLQLLPATAALLPYLLQATRAIGPTLIMYEASVTWGWAVARILGIPSVCVCSMNVGNTLNAMNPLIHEALMHDEATREANVLIKERYGVDVMEESEFYFHYSKNFNLVTTAKPINPPFARHHALKVRADTFHFVGPMMDKRFRACTVPYVERLALQTKLTLARKNSKVVLVSFGTIVMDEYWSLCRTDVKGTLSLLADALGGQCDTLVLIATGSNKAVQKEVRSTLAGFSGQPPVNFLLHSFVDQLKILETVADVFITHGGQNSLMEALYFKTPCIVIPFFGDQPENAARIEEIGCGSYLKKDHWKDPSELIMTINKYRQRSLQVQQALDQASASLRSCGGPEAGANKVLELTDLMTSHDDIFNMDIC